MPVFAILIAALLLLWTALMYLRFKLPGGFTYLPLKLIALATAPLVIVGCAVAATSAAAAGQAVTAAVYGVLALLALIPTARVFGAPDALAGVVDTSVKPRHLLWRWTLWSGSVPEPRLERDVPFWTLPDSGQPLLCDLWTPPAGVAPSGLAYIYYHGSGWVMLDKDIATRPMFRRLAAQGHVVMDVAYRLWPETDMYGMLADVRRAIAWMKANAARYGVNPDRIVIGGASAGGHLSLLAAFTEGRPELTPADLTGVDTAVQGVVSSYGPVDLREAYRRMNVDKMVELYPEQPDMNGPLPPVVLKIFGPGAGRWRFQKALAAGRLDWVLGGTPETAAEQYSRFSPTDHVHPGCPPVLLIHGTDDIISPAAAVELLGRKLRAAGVPAATLILPQTDHAFDLLLFRLSPAARVAQWHIERFLAALAAVPSRRLPKKAAM